MIRTFKVSLLYVAMFCGFGGVADASNYSFFTSPPSTMSQGTIGFTFVGNKFVGTVLQNGTGSLYSTDLAGNNAQPFAPGVSLTSTTAEHYVAGSFGNGFSVGDLYAADGSNIIHIANNGTSLGTFVSGLSGEVRGIMFDQGGTFGNQMLVTTSSGEVYTVSNGGVATALANLSQNVEGLDIAPAGFGSYGGQLIVSSENGGGLFWAVKPNGSVTPLPFTVPSAEESTFVPLSLAPGNSTLVGLRDMNRRRKSATFWRRIYSTAAGACVTLGVPVDKRLAGPA